MASLNLKDRIAELEDMVRRYEMALRLVKMERNPIAAPTATGWYWYTGPGFPELTLVDVEWISRGDQRVLGFAELDRPLPDRVYREVRRARGTWYRLLKPE